VTSARMRKLLENRGTPTKKKSGFPRRRNAPGNGAAPPGTRVVIETEGQQEHTPAIGEAFRTGPVQGSGGPAPQQPQAGEVAVQTAPVPAPIVQLQEKIRSLEAKNEAMVGQLTKSNSELKRYQTMLAAEMTTNWHKALPDDYEMRSEEQGSEATVTVWIATTKDWESDRFLEQREAIRAAWEHRVGSGMTAREQLGGGKKKKDDKDK